MGRRQIPNNRCIAIVEDAALDSTSLIIVIPGPRHVEQNDVDDFLHALFDELHSVECELGISDSQSSG